MVIPADHQKGGCHAWGIATKENLQKIRHVHFATCGSFTKSPQQSQKHIHLPMSFSTLDKSRMWFVQPRWMPGINRANCPTGCYLEITSWRWMILVSVTWWHVNWRGKTFWNGLGCFGKDVEVFFKLEKLDRWEMETHGKLQTKWPDFT